MPEDDEEPSFFQRYRILFAIGGLLLMGVGWFAFKALTHKGSSSRQEPMMMVSLPPPPPPPPKPTPTPPPPPDQPQPENNHQDEKLVDQKIDVKPPPEKPPDAPAPLGTSISGPGPGMGLSSGIGGLGGNGTGTGGGGGSRFGWYYGQVQKSVTNALRNNPRTRKASISGLIVRIWPDATGRVTRVTVSGDTGDQTVQAIQNDVLNNMQLSEPPPKDMKLPIILRISERRPN